MGTAAETGSKGRIQGRRRRSGQMDWSLGILSISRRRQRNNSPGERRTSNKPRVAAIEGTGASCGHETQHSNNVHSECFARNSPSHFRHRNLGGGLLWVPDSIRQRFAAIMRARNRYCINDEVSDPQGTHKLRHRRPISHTTSEKSGPNFTLDIYFSKVLAIAGGMLHL